MAFFMSASAVSPARYSGSGVGAGVRPVRMSVGQYVSASATATSAVTPRAPPVTRIDVLRARG